MDNILFYTTVPSWFFAVEVQEFFFSSKGRFLPLEAVFFYRSETRIDDIVNYIVNN